MCRGLGEVLNQNRDKGNIIYKQFYNKERGLPEPVWGGKVSSPVMCPTCGSMNIRYSAHPDDPEEVLGDVVRCKDCGHITDLYEAIKQRRQGEGSVL